MVGPVFAGETVPPGLALSRQDLHPCNCSWVRKCIPALEWYLAHSLNTCNWRSRASGHGQVGQDPGIDRYQ